MWLMLQQEKPGDYVVATGRATSIREFCRLAFRCVSLDYQEYVVSRSDLLRPAEVDYLLGDASKAKAILGWQPTIALEDMIAEMVEADLARHRTRLQS